MKNEKPLSAETAAEIEDLIEQADDFLDDENHKEAYVVLMRAVELLPEPPTDYEEGRNVFATLGDLFFETEDYVQSLGAFSDAVACPEGLGNPFIHLRLGQCQYELGNLDRAADELMRAHMGGGREIFEDEDEKYLSFLATRGKLD